MKRAPTCPHTNNWHTHKWRASDAHGILRQSESAPYCGAGQRYWPGEGQSGHSLRTFRSHPGFHTHLSLSLSIALCTKPNFPLSRLSRVCTRRGYADHMKEKEDRNKEKLNRKEMPVGSVRFALYSTFRLSN